MTDPDETTWTVLFTGKARKQRTKLPLAMVAALALLEADLKAQGPVLLNWPHYGKVVGKKDVHHCHLNKGKPRYVAVWKVTEDSVQLLEIRYVGTHENADYRRID